MKIQNAYDTLNAIFEQNIETLPIENISNLGRMSLVSVFSDKDIEIINKRAEALQISDRLDNFFWQKYWEFKGILQSKKIEEMNAKGQYDSFIRGLRLDKQTMDEIEDRIADRIKLPDGRYVILTKQGERVLDYLSDFVKLKIEDQDFDSLNMKYDEFEKQLEPVLNQYESAMDTLENSDVSFDSEAIPALLNVILNRGRIDDFIRYKKNMEERLGYEDYNITYAAAEAQSTSEVENILEIIKLAGEMDYFQNESDITDDTDFVSIAKKLAKSKTSPTNALNDFVRVYKELSGYYDEDSVIIGKIAADIVKTGYNDSINKMKELKEKISKYADSKEEDYNCESSDFLPALYALSKVNTSMDSIVNNYAGLKEFMTDLLDDDDFSLDYVIAVALKTTQCDEKTLSAMKSNMKTIYEVLTNEDAQKNRLTNDVTIAPILIGLSIYKEGIIAAHNYLTVKDGLEYISGDSGIELNYTALDYMLHDLRNKKEKAGEILDMPMLDLLEFEHTTEELSALSSLKLGVDGNIVTPR